MPEKMTKRILLARRKLKIKKTRMRSKPSFRIVLVADLKVEVCLVVAKVKIASEMGLFTLNN